MYIIKVISAALFMLFLSAALTPTVICAAEPPAQTRGLSIADSVSYDPALKRIYTGLLTVSEIKTNYFYDEHTVHFANSANWRMRRVFLREPLLREALLLGDHMVIRCEKGCFAEYIEDGENSYIQLTEPKELYETVVVIDPGHGKEDYGAVVNRTVFEKDIDLDIVLRLLEAFENEKILLLPTRTEEKYVSLEYRFRLANKVGDYFISVHNNVDERSQNTGGTITYHHNHETDAPITSRELAEIAQSAVAGRLQTRDRGAVNSDVYRILLNSKIPTALVEVMFMSNPGELARLEDPACRQEIALALLDAINALPPARNLTARTS
ncbi:MAG: N-acetylmuramoyl-L-alanine amidase [Clostridiales bacterium]|jgi:N-acetylmuramoyl-L-alanine amidase|nr:N-acetylmuramoyl-L-alanine amidase [Clostridiales bacterium]